MLDWDRRGSLTALMLVTAFLTWAAPVMGAAATGPARYFEGKGALDVEQSIHFVRLSDRATLFEKEPDRLVSPASVTKVLTAAAALARFTPAHTFATPVYHTGAVKNGHITGDLVVVGAGDPFIVSEKLWQFAADLYNSGIRAVDGGIQIDNGLFDGESRDESRKGMLKASRNAYDAAITAFAVNFNTYAVAVAPGPMAGKAALVATDPYPLAGVAIENGIRTGKAGSVKSVDVKRAGADDDSLNERLSVSGSIPADAGMHKVYRSVGNPVIASGEYLKAFLKAAGIQVRGGVRAGRRPDSARLLATIDGYDMRKIVNGLNVYSNNFIADMMVKRLGAAFPPSGPADQPGGGTLANGVQVIRDFMRKDVGIKTEFKVENGSGLDTDNRLSARQVTSVLAHMESRMDLFPDFLASLPATGWDGTLKKRFAAADAEHLKGLFRAKTGTLTEPVTVVGLAGYYRHPKHGYVAFCILENGRSGQTQPSVEDLRLRQDKALVAMLGEI